MADFAYAWQASQPSARGGMDLAACPQSCPLPWVLDQGSHPCRREFPPRTRGWYVLVLLLNFFLAGVPLAQASKEYEIKAGLLLNLARFVEWPPEAFPKPEAPVVIGVVGRDPFGVALDEAVKGERVNGRSIKVVHFDNPRQVRPCQILFISRSEKTRVREILAGQQGQTVLTVSDLDRFTSLPGGMVQLFVNDQSKVRLRVNLQTVQAHALKLSAKLLQVAEVTHGGPEL